MLIKIALLTAAEASWLATENVKARWVLTVNVTSKMDDIQVDINSTTSCPPGMTQTVTTWQWHPRWAMFKIVWIELLWTESIYQKWQKLLSLKHQVKVTSRSSNDENMEIFLQVISPLELMPVSPLSPSSLHPLECVISLKQRKDELFNCRLCFS